MRCPHMSIELTTVFPPAPSTERARRTPLSYDKRSNSIAYGSNKLVVVRSVENPETSKLIYNEHLQPVTSVAFAPSGFFVASGDLSGQVRVWNTDGEERITKGPYQATSDKINGIAWCHESSRILAVGDGKERFGHGFTADSGNTVAEISGHSAMLNGVAVRPKRPMRAVTVGEDGSTVFYQGPPFRFVKSTSKHVNAISDVAYSPDGAHFATGGCDRKLAVYDGDTGDFKSYVDTEHEGMILSVSFASDNLILSASADCSVRLSDITTGKLVKAWKLPRELKNQQTGVVAAGDDLYISISLNGDLLYWEQSSDKPVRIVQGHQKQISSVQISDSDNGTPFSGSIDGTVYNWDLKKGGKRIDSATHDGPVAALVGDLYSVGWDKKILKVVGEGAGEKPVYTTELQPHAASAVESNFITISENSIEALGSNKSQIEFDGGRGTAVHLVDDIAVIGYGVTAAVYSYPKLEQLHKFDPRQSEVSAVSISPDKNYVAVGDASGKITLYNLSDYSMKTSRWTFHTSRVTSISWTKDSLHAVTSGLDTNIFVYSVERPARNIKCLGAHKEGVIQVVWDGDHIVSGGVDGAVKRWKVTLHQ